ncbi:hypothetical protein QBC42DRAFT_335305 [Cladorrhinum samala]|uniref:UVI-1 protein n=1 Tax=Cladorrhinum samala TaxID=585594 RepID=A0AAV9I279_9PEZI|nr:hypothetical protein QBC42DRAFT_335305 [Cladorrhinum samala]
MVSIRSLFTSAVAMMALPVMGAVTPQQIAGTLKDITDLSLKLQKPAQAITIVNAPLIIIGQGPFPELIKGFTEIVTVATTTISQFPGTPQITSEADGTLVFDSFRAFVSVHQQLLNILIGKAGILTQIPLVGAPVAAVLRSVEGVVDSIAIFLINTVETRAKDLTYEANSLGNTLDLTIQKYQGLQI